MVSYSKELVERCINFYKEKGQNITEEEAQTYLDSLADLYEAVGGLIENKKV